MRIPVILLLLALLAGAAVAAAGLGYRFGLWPLSQAFDILRIGAYASGAALALSVIGLVILLWRRRVAGVLMLAPAVLIAGFALYVPWKMADLAKSHPPIHDISTDLDSPPDFVALKAAREKSPNGWSWSGNSSLQRQHYADVAPVTLKLPREKVMPLVESAARGMGMSIVEANIAEGRIEASDRTAWFGFTDDIVIRLRSESNGTRVDIRSASRVGVSDLGQNAERVRDFLARLKAQPQG